jgi:hypothetical protein
MISDSSYIIFPARTQEHQTSALNVANGGGQKQVKAGPLFSSHRSVACILYRQFSTCIISSGDQLRSNRSVRIGCVTDAVCSLSTGASNIELCHSRHKPNAVRVYEKIATKLTSS